jgi:hypothetical protein
MVSLGVSTNGYTKSTELINLHDSSARQQYFNWKDFLDFPKHLDLPMASINSRGSPFVCGQY